MELDPIISKSLAPSRRVCFSTLIPKDWAKVCSSHAASVHSVQKVCLGSSASVLLI